MPRICHQAGPAGTFQFTNELTGLESSIAVESFAAPHTYTTPIGDATVWVGGRAHRNFDGN